MQEEILRLASSTRRKIGAAIATVGAEVPVANSSMESIESEMVGAKATGSVKETSENLPWCPQHRWDIENRWFIPKQCFFTEGPPLQFRSFQAHML